MDILFINQIDFSEIDVKPQMGQLILNSIVKQVYDSEWINFDLLNMDSASPFKYVRDMDENIHNIVDYILSKQPRIVGFYTICNSFEFVVEIAEKLKSANSSLTIILGGPHASVLAEEIFVSFNCFDFISVGESEKNILPLIESIMNNRDLSEYEKIPGLCYVGKNGKIYKNERAQLVDADELIKYSVSVPNRYKGKPPFIDIEGGRGCPFQCTFCSTSKFWRREHRVKPIDDLLEEISRYRQEYGINRFYIVHDHFVANRKHIMEFCKRIIEEKLDFEWSCSSRVDILDETLLDNMRAANCVEIYLGIETGSKKMQKDIKKYLDIDKAEQTIRYMKKIGIDEITTSFIFGFPHETIDDFRDTIKLMEKILMLGIKSVQLHRLMIFAGSEEQSKVPEGSLYFDIDNMRITKAEKKAFTNYGLDLVKKYPKLFYQFYTFETEVFHKFRNFDDFLVIITTGMTFFNKSIQCIIKMYSLEKLYYRLKEDVDKFHEKNIFSYTEFYPNHDEEKKRGDEYINYMDRVIQSIINENLDCEYLRMIYSFEKQYSEFGENSSVLTKVLAVTFDVFVAMREERIVYEETYIRFSRLEGKISIEKISKDSYFLLRMLQK